MKRLPATILLLLLLLPAPGLSALEYRCPPTPPDADGPFYRPGAPVTNRIGSGYELSGEVKSASVLSARSDSRLPLRWIGLLSERVNADLAATGGIHTAQDVVKMLLVGAKVAIYGDIQNQEK